MRSSFSVGVVPTLVLLSAAVSGVCSAGESGLSEEAGPGPEGVYAVSGVSRDGSLYSSTLTIEATGSHSFALRWEEPDATYTGQGALVGDTLFEVWGSQDAQCFAVFLDVMEDGVLDGFWFGAADPNPVRGTERAVPAGESKGSGPGGSYLVDGVAPDGTEYSSRLEVTPLEGRYYRFRWQGDAVLEGIGELQDDGFQVIASVAGHDGQCGRSVMTTNDDGNWSGYWTMNDDNFAALGQETAVRK